LTHHAALEAEEHGSSKGGTSTTYRTRTRYEKHWREMIQYRTSHLCPSPCQEPHRGSWTFSSSPFHRK